ncbi:MAG: hypothetical protein MUP70_08730 [Candidatus Aminicenantes bacterium]|nr:hypothetical protein [Candidatus Aminicenantes bacterium]
MEKKLKIYAYVILDNHFHMICQSQELSRTLQSLKRHTSKCILEQLKQDQKNWILQLLAFYKKKHKKDSQHQLWQEGFHPQQIISEVMFKQKVEYIHQNPVKRGYVEAPEDWCFSSAGEFLLDRRGPKQLDPVTL